MRQLFAVACVLMFVFCAPVAEAEQTPPQDVAPEDQDSPDSPPPDRAPQDADDSAEDTSERISAALKWLADHQHVEGLWRAMDFRASTARGDAKATGTIELTMPGPDNGWEDIYTDIGVTALALQAFTATRYSHREGTYRQTMRQGILFLRRVQGNDGCFGGSDGAMVGAEFHEHFVYAHALATTAMAEAYRTSRDPLLRPLVERAADFILRAQNPGKGWRYGIQPGMSDSSITGMMMHALYAVNRATDTLSKVQLATATEDANSWFKEATAEVDGRYRTGYLSPGGANARLREAATFVNNPTLDAIHGWCLIKSGTSQGEQMAEDLLARVTDTEHRPRWENRRVDFYFWYWGTTYLGKVGGDEQDDWNKALREVLLKHQRGWHPTDVEAENTSPDKLLEHGSWDPVGAWGRAGGRVYSTAMAALMLTTME
jgi:hypothetical protein